MKSFKKISLKGITEILSEKEMKNVMGGSGGCNSVGPLGYCGDNSGCCGGFCAGGGTCKTGGTFGVCSCY